MADNRTRVRIAYTVALDEVPARISTLIKEAEADVETAASRLAQAAEDLVLKGNIKEVVEALTKSRTELMSADLCLQDCHDLLANYHAVQLEGVLQDAEISEEEGEQKLVEHEE